MIFFISILFVLFMAVPIGTAVARRVDDEIEAGGTYLEMGPDALLFVILAIFLYALDFPILALTIPTVLILLRYFVKLDTAYGPLTGIVLGLSFSSEIFVSACLLILGFNYIWGLLGEKWKLGLWQPVMAIAGVLIGIPWLHP